MWILTLGSVVIKNINLFHDMSHEGRIRKKEPLKNKTCDEVWSRQEMFRLDFRLCSLLRGLSRMRLKLKTPEHYYRFLSIIIQ